MAEIDYFESCDTDANAQAAYVTNATPDYGADTLYNGGGTASASSEYDATYLAAKACDGNDGTYWATAASTTCPITWDYDYGSGVTKTIRKLTIKNLSGNGINGFDLQGSNNGSSWSTIYSGSCADNGNTQEFTFSNSTAYRYMRVNTTSKYSPGTNNFFVATFQMMELNVSSLQSYSEATIKTQGSYALKAVATTGALNKTLTHTF